MLHFAFVSRHAFTPQQAAIAAAQNIELIQSRDMDAFSPDLSLTMIHLKDDQNFDGIICVHPLVALIASSVGLKVGIFNNVNRAPVGEKPRFETTTLVVR
jgi:hypothetical protein